MTSRALCVLVLACVAAARAEAGSACHGSVHYVVRDEAGGILAPERLDLVSADPAPTVEPLALETGMGGSGTRSARVLRLGDCSFDGELVLRLRGKTMALEFHGLRDDNDVAYEVDGVRFREGRFALDFRRVPGPLVPSTAWVQVPGDDASEAMLARLEDRLSAALTAGDRIALEGLVAPDAAITDPVLGILDGRRWIEAMTASGDRRAVRHHADAVLVSQGDALVAAGQSVVERGGVTVRRRFTRVWGRRDGRFVLLAQQEGPEPAPRRPASPPR